MVCRVSPFGPLACTFPDWRSEHPKTTGPSRSRTFPTMAAHNTSGKRCAELGMISTRCAKTSDHRWGCCFRRNICSWYMNHSISAAWCSISNTSAVLGEEVLGPLGAQNPKTVEGAAGETACGASGARTERPALPPSGQIRSGTNRPR